MLRALILTAVVAAIGCNSNEFPTSDKTRQALSGTVPTVVNGGELPLPLDAPGFRNQEHVAVGTDGTNFLVVWRDGTSFAADIMGMRVDPNGVALDPEPFLIGKKFVQVGSFPRVAFDGTNYLVVWAFGSSLGASREIWGNRVGTDGVPLDGDGFIIGDGAGERYSPDVAFNGQDFVVVWSDRRSGISVWANRVSTAGTTRDGDGFALTDGSKNEQFPSIACQPNQCLVAWRASGTSVDIEAARLDATGSLTDPAPLSVAATAESEFVPRVMTHGSDYVVAWQQGGGGDADILAREIPATGAISAAAKPLLDGATEDGLDDVIATAGGFVVVSSDSTNSIATEFDSTLTPTGSTSNVAADAAPVAIATNGTQAFAVWPALTDALAGDQSVFGSIAPETLAQPFVAPSLVGAIPNKSDGHAVYYDGTEFVALWSDRRTGDFKLHRATYAQAATGTSEPLWPRGGEQYHVATTALGADWLVVWTERVGTGDPRLWGGFIRGGATEEPFFITGFIHQGAHTALASDGTSALAIWSTRTNGIAARLIDAAGPTGSQIAAPTAGINSFEPTVAWGAENYLAVWTQNDAGDATIRAMRVAADGTALDAAAIDLGSSVDSTDPRVFWNGSSFTVVFAVVDDAGSRLEYVRVGSDGALLDASPVTLQVAAARAIPSSVVADGEHAVLAYTNDDNVDAPIMHVATVSLADHTVTSDEPIAGTAPGGSSASSAIGEPDSVGIVVPRQIEASSYSTRLEAYTVEFSDRVNLAGSTLQTDEDTPVTAALNLTLPAGVDPALTVVTPPTKGTASIAGVDLTYTPDANENGSDELTVMFDDGTQQAGPVTISIEIAPVDDPPEFVAPTPDEQAVLSVDASSDLVIDFAAIDVDGDEVTVRLEADSFATLDEGAVTWSAGAEPAAYPVTLVATANGVEVSRTFMIDVAPGDQTDVGSSGGDDVGAPDMGGSVSPEKTDEGCGCATSEGSPGSLLFILLGLLLRRRR